MQLNRERLHDLIDKLCLITDVDITLSTGARASFYFDCKKATLNGESLNLIAEELLKVIDGLGVKPTAIGGLTMGADFIVAAVILRAYQANHPTINGSIVRKESKKHGTRSHIENELPSGTKIVVVDDVFTTGRSTATACDKLIEAGYQVVGIVALVDRESGGSESLAERYHCPVQALFRKSDFPRIAASEQNERTSREVVVSA